MLDHVEMVQPLHAGKIIPNTWGTVRGWLIRATQLDGLLSNDAGRMHHGTVLGTLGKMHRPPFHGWKLLAKAVMPKLA